MLEERFIEAVGAVVVSNPRARFQSSAYCCEGDGAVSWPSKNGSQCIQSMSEGDRDVMLWEDGSSLELLRRNRAL